MSIATASLGMMGSVMQQATVQLSIKGEFPSLGSVTGWLNSQPLTAGGLRGKVVLIDFCTYTCINWLRQLPYVRAWSEKYRDRGLIVIGVHTPEFPFEKDIENVRRALKGIRSISKKRRLGPKTIYYWPYVFVDEVHRKFKRIRSHSREAFGPIYGATSKALRPVC